MKKNSKKTVVILYSYAKREFFQTQEQFLTEEEVHGRAKIVKKRLEKMGYNVVLLPGTLTLTEKLKRLNPHVVFNLVDSIRGNEELSSIIPSLLELLNIPYTGASTLGLSINADKYLTKTILKQENIPVPNFQQFFNSNEKINSNLKFPLIVKLNKSHGSLSIDQNSIVNDKRSLQKRISYLLKKFNQSAIVEEYIKGKEITVLMIDDTKKKIILAEERIFLKKEKYNLFSFETAWSDEELYDCKKFKLNKKIQKDIIKAFKILQMDSYARFEIIIDKKENYFFIDPNANPAFGPLEAGEAFGNLLHIYNIPFEQAVEKIIFNSLNRQKNSRT